MATRSCNGGEGGFRRSQDPILSASSNAITAGPPESLDSHRARAIRPLACVQFDGVMMTVAGRGYDRRCGFCRTVRTVIRRSLRIDVLRSDCPFDPNAGDFRPRPGEELIGLAVELVDLESGQQVARQIVREGPDPAAGIITWESPIEKGLVGAGGLHAEQGTEIVVHGRPMYWLVGLRNPGTSLA